MNVTVASMTSMDLKQRNGQKVIFLRYIKRTRLFWRRYIAVSNFKPHFIYTSRVIENVVHEAGPSKKRIQEHTRRS